MARLAMAYLMYYITIPLPPFIPFCAFERAIARCTPLVPFVPFVPFVAPLPFHFHPHGFKTTFAHAPVVCNSHAL